MILDLEDSVPPSRERRRACAGAQRAARGRLLWRRADGTHQRAATGARRDSRAGAAGVDAFLLPKVEQAETIQDAAALLDRLGANSIGLIPIVESARGVLSAYAIASASPRVVALAIGLEDYTADIGAQRSAADRESLWAQSQVLNAARAADVQPLASVYSAIDDERGLSAWVEEMRGLGFEGAGCLHPRQVRIVHASLAPSPAEAAQARRIVDAFEAAQAAGLGALALDGKMIDAPVVARARRVAGDAINPFQPSAER